jgi:hypothetical protein
MGQAKGEEEKKIEPQRRKGREVKKFLFAG